MLARAASTAARAFVLAWPGVAQPISSAARADLAPSGTVRVAINYGNFLIVARNPDGEPGGIAPDLAREIARRAGVAVAFVGYERPGHMAEGVRTDAWDIAFLAAEAERANEIAFTAPYLEVDATYLVPEGSTARAVADLDREGVRIVVANKSAYDLFLTRTLRHAQLIRAEGLAASVERFVADRADALAGIRPILVKDAARLPGSRVLPDRYTPVQQAIGIAMHRSAGAAYLREFVDEVKASGMVARAIEHHRVRDVAVAP